MTSFTETCDTCAQINAYVTYYCFIDKIAYSQIQEFGRKLKVRIGSLKVKLYPPSFAAKPASTSTLRSFQRARSIGRPGHRLQ